MMTAPEQPGEGREPLKSLLGSPDLVHAIENEDYKQFLDCLPIAIAVAAPGGGQERITYCNAAFSKMLGVAQGGEGWSILRPFVRADGLDLGKAVAEGDDFLGIFRRAAEDENGAAVVAYVGRIENDEGVEKYRFVALADLPAESSDEDLERQLREKDLLLREMQHRVKNNLQLIVGLIRLEARSVHRGDKVDLERLARRIEAVQLLYQTMTVEGWGEEIDLGQYLSRIASAVVNAHGHDEIKLKTATNYSPAPINIALPIGLAVNELMTNAFKHAFPGQRRGTIVLECIRHEHDYRIVIADDGVGFAPGTTWPVEGKLGALIIQTLRENAKVDLSVVSSGVGTKVVLTFVFTPRSARAN